MVHRLGLKETRPGSSLFFQFIESEREWFGLRCSSRPDKERRRAVESLPGHILSLVQTLDGLQQLDRIQIKDRFPCTVVAKGDMVAGKGQHIPYPHGSRAEQLALQGQAVTVTAGDLEDGLDPLPLQQGRRSKGGYAHRRTLVVGDVDCVHHTGECPGFCQEVGAVAPLRGTDFCSQDKTAGFEFLLQASSHNNFFAYFSSFSRPGLSIFEKSFSGTVFRSFSRAPWACSRS